MTTIRDRIIQAGMRASNSNETVSFIAAAAEALRLAKARADMAWGDCGRGCEAKYIFKAINQLLTEIETGSREDTNDLGGPSPTEAAGTGARVPAPELPHAVRLRDDWRGLAAWMRAPGTIDKEDAIDSCARAVENYAEYQFKLASVPMPDMVGIIKETDRLCTKYGYALESEFAVDLAALIEWVRYHGPQPLSTPQFGSVTEPRQEHADSPRRSAAQKKD